MSKEYHEYASSLVTRLQELYQVAIKAREKGFDPSLKPEIDVAEDLASLVEGLAGPPDVAVRIRELSQTMSREELAFKIAEEVVFGRFGHLQPREAAEQAVRTALAILTEGITAAPLQGVAKVDIKDNFDKTKYLAIYFAGPIRSAGGTEQALTLVIGDFVRKLLGLDRYKPTPEEVNRFIEEIRLYERSIGRFQYKVSDEELKDALESLPVEVTGIESDRVEVSTFRNLLRVETNRIRGGALRVVNDGIVGRSLKVCTIIEKLGIEGWEWLKKTREIKEKKKLGFMDEVIAGRPIFSFPSTKGGFRLRYGRARNTGLSGLGVHPATMMVLQQFLAAGTQIRVEGPGKAGVVLPVDGIEPPIVKLKDGSVVRVSLSNFDQVKDRIEKILFIGDLLVSYGDFLYTNKLLQKTGMTEELWVEELEKALEKEFKGIIREASVALQIDPDRLQAFLSDPFESKPTAEETLVLASALRIPLHPAFTHLWHYLTSEELLQLRTWLLGAQVKSQETLVNAIEGVQDSLVKKLLEKACIPHTIVGDRIRIESADALFFAVCLGWNKPAIHVSAAKPISEIIQELSGLIVLEKSPTHVGARMGRPEKAKRREMRPLVHALFPVGLAGGSHRSLIDAMRKGAFEVEIVRRRCPVCRETSVFSMCPKCKQETVIENICSKCGKTTKENICHACGSSARSYAVQSINLKNMVTDACGRLNISVPDIVKGVKGLSNQTKTAEVVEKGLLRAKHDLSVFKDGTMRFDATNAPLTHFKPAEVQVSLEKLRMLGYTHDHKGAPLENVQQICELKVQDVVVPLSCAEYFVREAHFLDELLVKLYGLSAFYNVRRIDDLVGHLVLGLAPHTSVGILGRVVGFTNLNVCYAHPLWHSAKRRDCDGDEDALMLALDSLLNFSKAFLPAQIGGMMDAPLFIIPVVNAVEVQRQAHEFDVASSYPLAFYKKTMEQASPHRVKECIDLVEKRLGTEAQFEGYGFTVPVSDINMGNRDSMYKRLEKMTDKLNSQLALAEKIAAVDAKKVALKVLTTHFIRDISGNLRAFTSQSFRCKGCNKKFRRLPLRGRCPECGGALTLTVYRGGIEKYLEAAERLIRKYDLPPYYLQRLAMVQEEVDSLFNGKKPKQISLKDFA